MGKGEWEGILIQKRGGKDKEDEGRGRRGRKRKGGWRMREGRREG